MSYNSIFFKIFTVCISLTLSVNIFAAALSFCSSLTELPDRQVCESVAIERPWLSSVQKIYPNTPLNKDTLPNSNCLYLLESRGSDNEGAIYFTSKINMPPNSALVGNGSSRLKPIIKFSLYNGSGRINLSDEGQHLLSDIEFHLPDEETDWQNKTYTLISGAGKFELSGLTFTVSDSIAAKAEQTYLISTGIGFYPNSIPLEIDINNCDFNFTDDLNSVMAHKITAVLVDYPGTQAIAKLKFANNKFTINSTNKANLKLLSIDGSRIHIEKDSNCNSLSNKQGVSLLSEVFFAEELSSGVGAIGFTNGYGWGF